LFDINKNPGKLSLMCQIILVRPGASDFDIENRIQGTLSVPLSAEGTEEIEQIANRLADRTVDVVYAPTCQPAYDSACTIAKRLNVRVNKLDRLENLDYGLWQGMTVDQIRRKNPKVFRLWQEKPETICPPEGETLSEATDRIKAVFTKLIKRNREKTVVLVLPEPMASLVRNYFDQSKLGDLWSKPKTDGGWEEFEIVTTSESA
jgi:broad specificity phosphatase PhoE